MKGCQKISFNFQETTNFEGPNGTGGVFPRCCPTAGSRAADDLRVLLRVVLLGLRVLEVEVHVAVVVVVLLSEGRPVPAQMSSNVIKRYQILSGLQLFIYVAKFVLEMLAKCGPFSTVSASIFTSKFSTTKYNRRT